MQEEGKEGEEGAIRPLHPLPGARASRLLWDLPAVAEDDMHPPCPRGAPFYLQHCCLQLCRAPPAAACQSQQLLQGLGRGRPAVCRG